VSNQSKLAYVSFSLFKAKLKQYIFMFASILLIFRHYRGGRALYLLIFHNFRCWHDVLFVNAKANAKVLCARTWARVRMRVRE